MKMPFFSVVVPLFNKERFILRCINSILTQTYQDFELIVIDDGSEDQSVERIIHIDEKRLTVIRQANQGPGAARNRGISESRAPWIAFLDADDMWMRDHLANLLKVIIRFPYAGLVSTGTDVIYRSNTLLNTRQAFWPPQIKLIDYFDSASRKLQIINSSSSAISRRVVRECGDFTNDSVGEDLE